MSMTFLLIKFAFSERILCHYKTPQLSVAKPLKKLFAYISYENV
jgi:hypothetical protein